MVMSYGPNNRNFAGLDRIFPKYFSREISGEFKGKIRLAHRLTCQCAGLAYGQSLKLLYSLETNVPEKVWPLFFLDLLKY